jgi:hypothetical protein
MKRIFIIALATLFVAGMFAETALAEERLVLTGEVRVRAWDTSGISADIDPNEDGDLTDSEFTEIDQNYFDQRFRVGATINAAEGVKGVLRFDFAEDKWGSDNWTGVRYNETSELQVDRAYLDVTKGMFNVKAGQQLIALGNMIAYDNNTTGLSLTLKTPVTVTLAYTKEDERGSLQDEDDDGNEDLDSYAIQVGFAQDNFGVKGFYAALKDGNDEGIEPNVFGIAANATLGMLSFKAELDVFGGEIGDVDVMGTQFWGNIEAAVMDNLKLGVDLIYSDGNDTDDEVKLTALNDWGDWLLADRGPFNTEIANLGTADAMDPDIFGIVGDVLDATGVDTAGLPVGGQGGAIGGGVYAVFTAMEGLDIYGQVMYLSADEDSETWLYDDVTVFNLGADWMFAPNAHLWLQYSKTEWSTEIDDLDDSYDVMVAQLSINF